jgi:hypothetical protein
MNKSAWVDRDAYDGLMALIPGSATIDQRAAKCSVESFRLLLGALSGGDGVAGTLACSSSSPGAGTGRLFACLCFV